MNASLRRRARLGLYILTALFLMVNWHEIGHTLSARAFGDAQAVYRLYARYPGGGYCLGCNSYDPLRLSFWGRAAVALGGAAFTQTAALILALGAARRSGAARSPWLAAAGVFAADLPLQVLQTLRPDVLRLSSLVYPTGVDIVDAALLFAGRSGISPVWFRSAALLGLAVWGWGTVRLYRRWMSGAGAAG